MQGLRGRGNGSRVFSQYLVFVSPLTDAETFEFHPFLQTDGGIQRQDPNLQRKLNTDLSGPAAVVLCPQCLQWIFVYSQRSVRPLAPRQTEIRVPLPSHSVSQVPLSQSQTTPRYTCAPEPLKNVPICLKSLMSFHSPFLKSSEIIQNGKPLLFFKQLFELCTCYHSGGDSNWAVFFD